MIYNTKKIPNLRQISRVIYTFPCVLMLFGG